MQNLSLTIICFFMLIWSGAIADSPHGKNFNINCSVCHSSQSWEFNRKTSTFNHNTTVFPLEGQHQEINCRSCHLSLVFSEAKKACADCHTDVHNQTNRLDCSRCHTPKSWIITDATAIHQQSRFPLVGAHKTADCYDCHKSGSLLLFEPLGTACVDCHRSQYMATTQPNHISANFSTDCLFCHKLEAFQWGAGFNHSFFPLTLGHNISDCSKCHKNGNFTNTPSDCYSCHSQDYAGTTNPNHHSFGIPTNCVLCHNTVPGWHFDHNTTIFPLTGAHITTACNKCHTGNTFANTPTNCYACHATDYANATDPNHQANNYPTDCALCHTTNPGWQPAVFNHNNTIFPLTGAHLTTACNLCHTNGFAGTTTICENCHTNVYTASTNPNHIAIGIPNTCALCHTTNPGWKPATFPIHNNYWPFVGAHITVSNNCVQCHNGNYNNTPNTCVGCHLTQYNQTNNPPHASSQFPTDCQLCHSQNAWSPSTFNHDQQWFPIFSGKHNGRWNTCSDCHTNSSNYQVFTCTTSCHPQAQTNNQHSDVSGYSYNSTACYACHPQGNAGKSAPGKVKHF